MDADSPATAEPAPAAEPAAEPAAPEPEAEAAPTGEGATTTPGSEDDTTPAAEETPAADPAAEPEKPADKTPLQKRFDELTAQRHELEGQLAANRERLASYEAAAAGKLEPSALEHLDSVEQLAAHRKALLSTHSWALTHPEGGERVTTDAKGQPTTTTYGPEEVRELVSSTFESIHEHVPAREQFLRERAVADAAAVTAYPWIKDTRNGPGAQVQALLESTPGVRRLGPNYRLIAADALIGQTLRDAGIAVDGKLVERLKAEAIKAKPAAGKGPAPVARRPVPPAAPARPGTVPPRVAPSEANARSAGKRLSAGEGGVNDLAASIAAKRSR